MSHSKPCARLVVGILSIVVLLTACGERIAHAGDDAAWLKSGTLIFEDSFDRKEPLPPDLAALLATKTKDIPWKADDGWHELVLVTEGDEMRATLDGKPLGSHRSEGFAHPTKRWFSFLMNPSAWIDDVKVYKVR